MGGDGEDGGGGGGTGAGGPHLDDAEEEEEEQGDVVCTRAQGAKILNSGASFLLRNAPPDWTGC